MKTLAIRLDEETHAQLVAVAALQSTTLVEVIREAVQRHLERLGAEGKLTERGQLALEEIERDAQTRRAAIQALMGQVPAPTAEASSRGRVPKRGEAAESAS